MTAFMFNEAKHRTCLQSLNSSYINIHDSSLLGRFSMDLYVYNPATFVATPQTLADHLTIASLQGTTGLFLHNGANYVSKALTSLLASKITATDRENWVPSPQIQTWTALGEDTHASSPGLPLRYILIKWTNGGDIIPFFMTDTGNVIGRFSDGNDFKVDIPILFHENNIMGDTA